VTQKLAQVRPMTEAEQQELIKQMQAQQAELDKAADLAQASGPDETAGTGPANPDAAEGFIEGDPSTWGNPGRNELCPCGSGKKFKHCHGRLY